MCDTSSGAKSKIHDVRIDDPIWLGQEAKRMSKALLIEEHRGPGDTIEAAAHRLQTRHGTDAAIILQCWNRPAREMKVSRWMSVFKAYWAVFGAKMDAAYEEKRNETTAHQALVRLADFVSGRTVHEETEG